LTTVNFELAEDRGLALATCLNQAKQDRFRHLSGAGRTWCVYGESGTRWNSATCPTLYGGPGNTSHWW